MSEITDAVDQIIKALMPTVGHDTERTLDAFLNDEDESWLCDSVGDDDLRVVIRAALRAEAADLSTEAKDYRLRLRSTLWNSGALDREWQAEGLEAAVITWLAAECSNIIELLSLESKTE